MSVWRRVVSRAKDYVQRGETLALASVCRAHTTVAPDRSRSTVKDGRPPLELPLYRFESLADVQQWPVSAAALSPVTPFH